MSSAVAEPIWAAPLRKARAVQAERRADALAEAERARTERLAAIPAEEAQVAAEISELHRELAGYAERDRVTARERAAWQKLDSAQALAFRLAAERRDLERGCRH